MKGSKCSRCSFILSKVFSGLFALAGIAVAALTILICIRFTNQTPILISEPETATENIRSMMDAVCEGDYEKAETYILDGADFGISRNPKDTVGLLIWDHFQNSMEYELLGECYATNAGLAQNVKFTYLDVTSITSNLRETAQALLTQRVENADSVTDIYDENNEYRADLIEDVLCDAAEAVIADDAAYKSVELVLNLKYQDGNWLIVADSAVVNALFGGFLF